MMKTLKSRILWGTAVMLALVGIVNLLPRDYDVLTENLAGAMLVAVLAAAVYQIYCLVRWTAGRKTSWNSFTLGFCLAGVAATGFNLFLWFYS